MESTEKALERAAEHVRKAIEILPAGCESITVRLNVAVYGIESRRTDLLAAAEGEKQHQAAVERDRKDAAQREKDAEHHRDRIAAAERDEREARKRREESQTGAGSGG